MAFWSRENILVCPQNRSRAFCCTRAIRLHSVCGRQAGRFEEGSPTSPAGNKGFIVERRRGGETSFETIASFESFAPLRTKGVQGGDYVYLDDTAAPGTSRAHLQRSVGF